MSKAETFFEDSYYEHKHGVYRWKSNDRIPFRDMLEAAGIREEIIERCEEQKLIEDAAAIQQYVRQREEHGYSAEERFEMRAAFGDEPVIDVFTGRKVEF